MQSLEILHKESVSVVPRDEDVLQDVTDTFFLEAQVLGAHHRRIDQIEPESVRSVLIHHQFRVRIVLLLLGHLLAIGGEHQPVDDQILERWFVE